MTANEYRIANEKLMIEYEQTVRELLADEAGTELSEKIPFFRDGIVCPEVWFQSENNFRPLFIMKEVNIGKKHISELDEYLEKWGCSTQFDFVTNKFDDVQVGTFPTWIRIAKLAKYLENVYEDCNMPLPNGFDCEDDKTMSFEPGGEKYSGDIVGYKTDKSRCTRTANREYDRIINQIAVINFKKVGAGADTQSEISTKSGYFREHIKNDKLATLLHKQIELINPTVIIRCGREDFKEIRTFKMEAERRAKERGNKILWIDGYHPSCYYNYLPDFYNIPLREYQQFKQIK